MKKSLKEAMVLGALLATPMFAQVTTTGGTVGSNAGGTSGNVGVGQSTPVAKLHVESSSTSQPVLFAKSNGNSTVPIFSLHNVLPSPSNLFYNGTNLINANSTGHMVWGNNGLRHQTTNSGNFQLGGFQTGPTETGYSVAFAASTLWSGYTGYASKKGLFFTGSNLELAALSNHAIVFSTNNGEKMRITDNNGYVGIGTSAPSEKLEVAGGNILLNNFAFWNANHASSFTWNGSCDHYPGSGDWGNKVKTPGHLTKISFDHATGEFAINTSTTSVAAGVFVPNSSIRTIMRTRPTNQGQVLIGDVPSGTITEKLLVNGHTKVLGKLIIGDVTAPDGFSVYAKDGVLTSKLKIALPTNATEWNWPDYVFAKDYKLASLESVASYIKENSHLPNIPSAQEISDNGIDVAKMDAQLLQKIEEMTLYLIEMNQKLNRVVQENEALRNEVQSLKK